MIELQIYMYILFMTFAIIHECFHLLAGIILGYKVKSIRISEDVETKFNKFCNEFKQYSKTSMLNYALIEFMEKYK